MAKVINDLGVNEDDNDDNNNSQNSNNFGINFNSLHSLDNDVISKMIFSIYTDILLKNKSNSNDYNSYSEIDFFSLGGDSFSSVECLWRLRELTGLSIRRQDLLKNIKELSDYIISSINNEELKRKHKCLNISQDNVTTTISTSNDINYNKKSKYDDLTMLKYDHIMRSNSSRYVEDVLFDKENLTININWTQKFNKCIDSSPLIVISSQSPKRGVVYIGSHGGDVKAIDSFSGDVIWSIDLGEHIEAAATSFGDIVYVCTYSGNDRDGFVSKRNVDNNNNNIDDSDYLGAVWAINAKTGEVIWICRTVGEIKSSPIIDFDDQVVYIGCYSGYLYSLNAIDGVIINKIETFGSIFSNPFLKIINNIKYVFVSTTTGLLHQVRILSEQNSQSGNIMQIVNTYTANSAIFSTHYFDENNNYLIFGTVDGFVHCLSAQLEDQLCLIWGHQIADGPIFASPCGIINNNNIIVGSHDGKIRCLTILFGELLWEINFYSIIFSSPFCNNRYCIICTTTGYVIIVDCNNNGKEIIRIKLNGEIYSSPILFNNNIYVGCRDDLLYCLSINVV